MRLLSSVFSILLALTLVGCQSSSTRSLAGQWRFSLDRQDVGDSQQWFNRDLPDRIHLPGSLQEQNFGDEPSANTQWISGIGAKLLTEAKYAPYRQPGHFETPFWLTPNRHYVGVAWYQRDINIPVNWSNRRIILHLQRPHWQTTLWLDGRRIGTNDSLGTPHDYDLTDLAAPGKHRLSIRIDNRILIPVGLDAHSVTDQTQTDWNGIVGDISLRTSDKIWIDDVQIYPNAAERKIRVVVTIGNHTHRAGDGILTALVKGDAVRQIPIHFSAAGGREEFEYDLGPQAQLWDEFHPALYQLSLEFKSRGQADSSTITFGLRDIATRGTQFILNGHPIMLRGTLECCIFPLTGYPPTQIAPWKRILTIARQHGLNHIRFHSWCPPEAAFEAADKMGFYFSVECSCWAHFGDGSPVDAWVAAEAQRMLRAYGNHPSFLLMVPSNEPAGKHDAEFLGHLIQTWEQMDPRRLYTAGSGWPITPENQYDVEGHTRLHNSREFDRAPQTASDYRAYTEKQPVPCVVHEMGQWCVYPNFDEIPEYTGSLKPGNLEIFRDFLNKNGMESQAHDFFMASGKFQALLYKAEIEEVLRTPGMGGFQLLDLHDFPGQGTAPVGVLDPFWNPRPYITAAQYRRFCNQTVPLARLTKRSFTSDETAHIEIDVSHFGPADLKDASVSWRVRDHAGKVLRQGAFASQAIATGRLSRIGSIDLALDEFPSPGQLNLEVSIDGSPFANDWDFWIYPPKTDVAVPPGVMVAHDLNNAALATLRAGGKVLLIPGPSHIAGNTYGAFEPIFWNRITFPTQRNHTLGILCDPKNPALAQFPTDFHSNWQWWDLQQHCKPMVLGALPKNIKPIVQMIDDWDLCRKLALVFEARVGNGKLIVCSIDLDSHLSTRPAARQMLRSLLAYMTSDAFSPGVQLSPRQIRSLLQ